MMARGESWPDVCSSLKENHCDKRLVSELSINMACLLKTQIHCLMCVDMQLRERENGKWTERGGIIVSHGICMQSKY